MEKQTRKFPDLLSVDAWHLEFTEDYKQVEFRAIVIFDQAKLGGKDDVSFTLKLKKARLEVGLPPGYEVPSDTIMQIEPKKGLHKTSDSKETNSRFSVRGLFAKNFPSVDLDAQASAKHMRTESIETESDSNLIEAKSGFVPGEKVWWDFTTINDKPLDGPAWRNDESILMTVNDVREDKERLREIEKALTPSIEVRVSCKREDLDIKIYGSRIQKLNPKNIASAEAFIRDVLDGKGLEYEDDLSVNLPTASIELISGLARTTEHEKN